MKKKVFSLMMTLLLAFMGVAKADVVTIGNGTSTTYVTPYNSLWGYSFVEQLFTADEIGTAGTITAISFNMQSTSTQTNSVDVFMKNVSRTVFSSTSDYETVTASDMVFSGTVTFSSGWTTITLDTPFEYDGTSSLMIGMHEKTSGYSTLYFYYTSATDKVVTFHSDSANPNPYDLGSYSGNSYVSPNRANIQIDITPGGGGGGAGAGDQLFAVQDGDVVDTVKVGPRPNGYWMEPFTFQIRNTGAATTITNLDWTPNTYFTLADDELLPFDLARDAEQDVALNTGDAQGTTDWQMVAIYGTGRTAAVWNINVEPYDAQTPDVWEMACEEATSFPFVEVPATAHNVTLYNNYTLPFPEIPEGYDAVYKLDFANDMMLNAEVTAGDNGKVALYTEDFYGEGGPMATNNYTGPTSGAGGGATGGSFEAQIGEGTTTTTYFPFYTFYNYCIAENLFLATELAEAGVTTSPMYSLSWYATNAPGYEQQGITIWMANVADTELTTTSHPVTGMTKVYTGAMTPAVGWNEFVFNEGSFAWDGNSNVLIFVQRNNGTYNSSVSWQATASMPFTAMSYRYQDSGAYDETIANTMYTSTTRPNIIMKSARGNREGNREIVEIGDGTGTTYYFPIDNYFNYSCTEQIYTADEIGTAGTINSISFYYNYGTAYTASNVTMYMKNVSRSNFAATTDCEPLALSDIVWTGSIAPTAAGWYTITLDTPFQYDGTSNLLVAFFDGTSGYPGTSYTWRQTTSPNSANMALRYYSDSSTPDPYNLASYTGSKAIYTYRSNVQIDITAGGGGGNIPANIAYGPVITDAPVEAGTYYLVASSTDEDFEVTINAVAMPCPTVDGYAFGEMPADNEDEVEPASVTLKWNIPAYATSYQVFFGSTYYPEPNHPQTIISDVMPVTGPTGSFTVRNLWNNTNYFWYVKFYNEGACSQGVESPHWGFTTNLNIPQGLTAEDETIFEDEHVVLSWNAVVDRTYRYYYIYRDGEKVGETPVNQIGTTTFTDELLDYNMDGYVYTVRAVYDEGISGDSDPVIVKVSGYSNETGINGYVYEQDSTTGIAGATVTLTGTDEFGDPHTYTATTGANGYYNVQVYAGTYTNAVAAKDGYQSTVTVHPLPFTVAHTGQENDVNFIMDEDFNPVCAVIAEYYPDSLDPHSPYVKVYWGCGLPGGEIIEDFETGDFSMFDWQVDATYPWSITTTNPYEGTYCMKSGGAGVASVTSNMTVTVEIPADGLMSFFGKVSCESNYDFGHFYIDGVEKGNWSGAGNWTERTYDITAGTHTFQWRYTKDSSVNSNDDCFYVDYINFYKQPEPAVPGMTYDFENSTMQGWTSVDADGDGKGWMVASELMSGVAGHNGSADFVFSQSYDNNVGVLYPDNYLVSPQVALGGIVTFYACAQDANYAAEHFGVAVSTTNTNPSSFTMLNEWTMSAKKADGKPYDNSIADVNIKGASRDGNNRAQGEWYQYTVDLSAYAGQTGYVAIRHFNCSDMFYLDVDDITISEPGKSAERAFSHYRVYRTNCYQESPFTEENTVVLACELLDTVYIDVEWADLEPGVYKWGVGVVYAGNRGEEIESPITWTEPVNVTPAKANRQTVTIGDGTSTTYVTPFNSLWGYSFVEQIFTAAEIGTAGTINSISFNLSSGTQTNQIDVFMKNVSRTNFSSSTDYETVTAADKVFSGTVTFNAGWTTITLDTPFQYDGTSNLMIGMHEYTPGYSTLYFNYTSATDMVLTYHSDSADPDPFNLGSYSGNKYTSANRANIQIDITPGGGSGAGGGEPIQEPRESEIVWSNCLDKDMYLEGDVTINVLLNSADNPEGTTVDFVNYNEAEQELYPMDQLVLDETGYYVFDSFRRGDYQLTIRHDGYETIIDSVSIWEPMDLRYVMIEIIYGVSDLYVSRTGWAMWDAQGIPSGGGQGGGQGSAFSYDLEAGLPAGWNVIDANNDGNTWCLTSNIPSTWTYYASLALDWYHSGSNAICSGSYINGVGALNPDEYLVTEQVTLTNGSTFSFWAAATDANYAADHFGVFVSDNGTSDWTMVNEWTLTAKGGAKAGDPRASRDGNGNRLGNWYQYTVDLSAFAGQKYIAIRHFNCYDQYIMCVDDIQLTTGAKNTEAERHLESFKVMCTSIDGEPIFNTNVPATQPFCQLATNDLVEGEHYICKVAAMYSTGMSDWLEAVWEYESCEHYAPVDGLEVTPENEGNYLVWEFDGQGGGGQGGQGDAFTESWDNGLNGWTNIDADGDGHMWYHSNEAGNHSTLAVTSHSGAGHVMGESYCNATWAALTPDDYLVSPQQYAIVNGSTLTFWGCAQDESYAAEHFGVAVSTGSNTNASDFTTIQEWTLTAKSAGNTIIGRDGRQTREGAWHQYTCDLSNYAGQNVWIAIRHFNCTDMFIMCLDDIELTSGAKSNRAPWEFFNGYVTDPGAMANGADASWTKNGQATWGPGCQQANGNRVGDSFTLTAATTINEIEVYGYQTGSSTTSTFNGLYAQIYNGNPMNGGQVVWGDANTNIMTVTAFTNCYRGSDGDATGTTRPIMSVTASGLNIELEAGTYYLVYQLNGTGSSGPWAAPHAEPNIGNTGNGVQYVSTGWQNLTDGGTSTPYGVAMKLTGSTGGQGPTPTGDIIGFMIFRDGQWLAQVGPEVRDYTDIDEFGEHEYCVRVIYNGTDVLPSNNFYYAMSCPVCQGDRCAAGEPIYGEVFRSYDQVRIWWGEYAAIEGVVKYNVYRSTDNATYTMVGEVPAVEGQVKYEYIDTPERRAGTYYYQVRADYGYCESEPAVSGENPAVNYVVISVTSVDENEGFAIFPNPTKANVTIQAKDMQHITVVSVLGQVVYDADVDTDEVILNMSQYAAGMYTVRVMTENGVRVERVSVVR